MTRYITSFGVLVFSVVDGKRKVLCVHNIHSYGLVDLIEYARVADMETVTEIISELPPIERSQVLDGKITDMYKRVYGIEMGSVTKKFIDKAVEISKSDSGSSSSSGSVDMRSYNFPPYAPSGYGYWSLPKGKKKSYETCIEAALREMEEESSLKRSDIVVLARSPISVTIIGRSGAKYKMVYYIAVTDKMPVGGKIDKKGETDEEMWIDEKDMDAYLGKEMGHKIRSIVI